MPKYNINTKIESNVPVFDLLYDLTVYRTDGNNKKHTLLSVSQQTLESGYNTKSHETNETDDDMSVIYIMEMELYRKHGGKTVSVLPTPARKMYTLGEMVSGKAYSKNKRENVCYFETKTQTKPVSGNGDDNIHNVQITCLERAFIAKEYPIGSPDDPFDKKKIESQVSSRINHSSYPNQGDTSLCGPASFFYCLLMDRPDVYKQAVNELWLYGKTKIGALNLVPSSGCRHPVGIFYDAYGERIKGIDWITLASLRDSENSILSYDEIDDQVSGITLWGGLTEWFVSAGYEKEFSNVGLSHVNLRNLSILNEYIKKGYRVVTLISAGMLNGFDSAITAKNHWIVWDGPIMTQNGEVISLTTNESEQVQLNLFSWGKVKNQVKGSITLSDVMKNIFGGVVFKPLK
ncbi:hypothetical protein [Lelliottia amnigena]|uniref:hypothetical protein n=1 Tax=Lelliottia amnigena TaxID=61646 RepID=UPI00195E742C|nr:hypothetical protein [Lelliottia amnigena]MBM7354604.1 hypothetical protein [Lelliottia amnigena]WSO20986.1 hypothetical protein VUJ45_07415 [Lelliottia amnigena]